MDLRSLRHVVVLARTLNYTRAAEELGLTQSALSRSIQSFEKRMNTRLFDRDRGGVQPTAIGRRFVERAEQVLRDAAALENSLLLDSSASSGAVAFGMAPMPAKALLASALPRLLDDHPELATSVIVRRTDALLPILQSGEIEFFVSADGQVPQSAALRGMSLGRSTLSLIVRPSHPLANRAGDAGRSYPVLVTHQLGGPMGERFAAIPALAGPQHLIEDYGAAARIAAQSQAIWVASPLAAAEEIRLGQLVEIPLKQFGIRMDSYRLMFYSLSQRTLSPAALALKNVFQRLLRAGPVESMQ